MNNIQAYIYGMIAAKILIFIIPVFILGILNTYKELRDGTIKKSLIFNLTYFKMLIDWKRENEIKNR